MEGVAGRWRPQAGAKRQAAHGRSAPTPDVLGLAAGSATCTFPWRADSVRGVEAFAPTSRLGEGALLRRGTAHLTYRPPPSLVRTLGWSYAVSILTAREAVRGVTVVIDAT